MDPQFLANLQELLQKLVFATDTQTIQSITGSLNQQFYTSPACIPALLTIAKDNDQWQVRQLAAVELRKRVPIFWGEIDEATRTQIREMILKMIVEEKDNLTRHGLARVISSIAQLDIPNQRWGNLIQFLYECCQSSVSTNREIGVYVLDSLFETIADTMADHMQHLFSLFSKLINDPESLMVQVTTIEALGKVADFIDVDDRTAISTFQGLVPAMAQVLQKCLATGDEDSASRCFEVFNTLLLLETPLLNPHFAELIEFSINVGSNQELDDNLRIMALNFLVWTTTYKRGRLQKLKIVQPLIQKMLPITAEEDPEDADDDSPSRVALRVLNVLSTNLPPQQVFPTVINLVLQYMQNSDPMFRKGAMLSLAITVEGCVDFIRPKTGDIVELVSVGLSDSDSRVRRASCMALGCIADELGEEVGQYHEKLLPLIFTLMNDGNEEIVKYACNALDAILEGLADNILKYLPQLMERLVSLLDNGPMEVKPIALAAIGSAAHASGDSFAPYFNEVVNRIKVAMALTGDDDAIALRGIATDTAGTVAETAGKDVFRPHLEQTMKLALEGMDVESSNLRDCGFCYFGVMSRVFEDELSQYLTYIMPHVFTTLRMDEDAAFELEAKLAEESEDDDGDAGLNVSTAIADEKEIAADAVSELFSNTRAGFLPFLKDTVDELIKLLEHYSDTARKSAISALFTFVKTVDLMASPEHWKPGVPLRVPIHENTASIIKLVIPPIFKMWEDEDDKLVVTQIFNEFRSAMQDIGPAIAIDYAEEIGKNALEVFQKKALCQTIDADDELEDIDEDDLAEYDSLLIGSTADCIAELADVFGEKFEPIMDTFLPHIVNYTKPTYGVSERAMAVGCLSEITKNMGPAITKYSETLFPIFMGGLQDPEADVRSNSAYGVGVLIEATAIDVSAHFNEVLKAVYPVLQASGNPSNSNDNAAGCVARMILENADAVPLGDVLPGWIAALPIKGDHLEDIPVYDAICHLLKNKRAAVEPFIESLTSVLKQAMQDADSLISEDSKQFLSSL